MVKMSNRMDTRPPKAGMSKTFARLQRQSSVLQKEEEGEETSPETSAEELEASTDAALAAACVAAEQQHHEAQASGVANKNVNTSLKSSLKSSLKTNAFCPVAPTLIRNGTVNPRRPLLFEEQGKERQPDSGFYTGADKFLFHLGGCKYLIINQAGGPSGAQRLRICELTTDPSRKTVLVRLNLQQWVDFCSWCDIISDVIEKERESEGSGIDEEDGQKRMHLGGNIYVSLKQGLPGVDFRWFWMPPSPTVDYKQEPAAFDVQPSRYGI